MRKLSAVFIRWVFWQIGYGFRLGWEEAGSKLGVGSRVAIPGIRR